MKTPRLLWPSLAATFVFTLLTGIAYPLAVNLVGTLLFPREAGGSIILNHERPVGSALLGQSTDAPGYFWGRPSGTAPVPYNGAASGGTNQGPSSPALADAVRARIAALRAVGSPEGPVPVDLVTASASGLDPDISPAAAEYQLDRVAGARGLPRDSVRALVRAATEGRQLGILGEPRVNVLQLNRALDALGPPARR